MKILISGGSGLVGTNLSQLLNQNGHEVRHLSRTKHHNSLAKVFEWDPSRGYIEDGALDDVEVIINLAGAGVADQKWTPKRKKLLLESRTKALECLHKEISKKDKKPRRLISASGIGYYGRLPYDRVSREDDQPGSTFLAEVCKAWEKEALNFENLDVRVSIMRIGIVLDREKGALPKVAQPIQWWVGAPLGSGQQVMPWIHILDICRMIQFVIDNEVDGPINAVGQDPQSNASFSTSVAKTLKKPFFLPNVPDFVLKLMLGEMAEIVSDGNLVSNQKIRDAGFEFQFNNLDEALREIYGVH